MLYFALQSKVKSVSGACTSHIDKAPVRAPKDRGLMVRRGCPRHWIEVGAHVDEDRVGLAILEGEGYRGVAPQQTGRWVFDRPVTAVEPPQYHQDGGNIGEFAALLCQISIATTQIGQTPDVESGA